MAIASLLHAHINHRTIVPSYALLHYYCLFNGKLKTIGIQVSIPASFVDSKIKPVLVSIVEFVASLLTIFILIAFSIISFNTHTRNVSTSLIELFLLSNRRVSVYSGHLRIHRKTLRIMMYTNSKKAIGRVNLIPSTSSTNMTSIYVLWQPKLEQWIFDFLCGFSDALLRTTKSFAFIVEPLRR